MVIYVQIAKNGQLCKWYWTQIETISSWQETAPTKKCQQMASAQKNNCHKLAVPKKATPVPVTILENPRMVSCANCHKVALPWGAI